MKQIIIALLLTLSIFSISATTQTKPQQWEYKIEFNVKEKKANELGTQGWELVAVSEAFNVQEYVFKRAR